eukprot:16430212-Heterocapsa_arctica.AAC.1
MLPLAHGGCTVGGCIAAGRLVSVRPAIESGASGWPGQGARGRGCAPWPASSAAAAARCVARASNAVLSSLSGSCPWTAPEASPGGGAVRERSCAANAATARASPLPEDEPGGGRWGGRGGNGRAGPSGMTAGLRPSAGGASPAEAPLLESVGDRLLRRRLRIVRVEGDCGVQGLRFIQGGHCFHDGVLQVALVPDHGLELVPPGVILLVEVFQDHSSELPGAIWVHDLGAVEDDAAENVAAGEAGRDCRGCGRFRLSRRCLGGCRLHGRVLRAAGSGWREPSGGAVSRRGGRRRVAVVGNGGDGPGNPLGGAARRWELSVLVAACRGVVPAEHPGGLPDSALGVERCPLLGFRLVEEPEADERLVSVAGARDVGLAGVVAAVARDGAASGLLGEDRQRLVADVEEDGVLGVSPRGSGSYADLSPEAIGEPGPEA